MAITLPASIQDLVGNRLLRLGTSYDFTKFFFDIPRAFDNSRRSRYAYALTGGTVLGSYNLSPALGATILSVSLILEGTRYPVKIVLTSNPTGSKVESSILYITYAEDTSLLLQENEDYLLQESGFRILLEGTSTIDDIILADAQLNRNLFIDTGAENEFFVIQEDDF